MLAVSSGTFHCEVSFQCPLHHFHNADALEPNCFPHSERANSRPPVRAGFHRNKQDYKTLSARVETFDHAIV